MDYRTKPTSRSDLRRYSVILRKLFGVPLIGAEVLDKVSIHFLL